MRRVPFYPLLLAIYPVLALLEVNFSQVYPNVAFRTVVLSVLFGLLIFGLCAARFRDWQRGALISALVLAWFFIYGHLYLLVKSSFLASLGMARHRFIFPAYTLLFSVLGVLILRLRNANRYTLYLNLMAILLLILPLLQMGGYLLTNMNSERSSESGSSPVLVDVAQPPDIYYIILDSYTRADVLKSEFGFNNQAFVDDLRRMGFYVADCSRSNYTTTQMSLASALNMDYLQNLNPEFSYDNPRFPSVNSMMQDNRVRQLLANSGYRSVNFQIEYSWAVWADADVLLKPSETRSFWQLAPFEALLARTTVIAVVADAQLQYARNLISQVNFPYANHVSEVNYILNKLPTVPNISGAKLVFAVILVPHNPLVFASDGSILQDENFYRDGNNPINEDYFQRGYISQVQFINQRILQVLQSLIQQSRTPPVIIVQGDHGTKGNNKPAILNAYYLPGINLDVLYPTISPVNSFRLVFDSYFGTHFNLLPDKSYFTPLDRIQFREVKESTVQCLGNP
jgi:hypothetical protein